MIRRTSENCILRIDFHCYWINFLKRVIETEEQFNELSKNHLIIHVVWKVKKKGKEIITGEREGEKFLSRFLLTSFICREGDIYIYTEHVLNRIKFNKKEGRGIVFHDFLRYPSIPVPWAWNKNGPVNGGNISYNSMCPHGLLI